MTDLATISNKIDGIASEVTEVKEKVNSLHQGINGGNGAIGLADQVKSHGNFIKENRPMMVIGRMVTYAGIGAIGSAAGIFIMKDTIMRLLGSG